MINGKAIELEVNIKLLVKMREAKTVASINLLGSITPVQASWQDTAFIRDVSSQRFLVVGSLA
jgi:hypothetical protein